MIELGYIEYSWGFKLHLPNFDKFKETHKKINSYDRNFWTRYKDGKIQYKAQKLAEEKGEIFQITNQQTYDLYRKNSYDISQYFKARAQYFKLCLNGPTQSMAALQTKAATNKVYEHIWKNNHFWKARIALVAHDEIDMEVIDELCEEYKNVIENAMKTEGNRFLTNHLLKMDCEANINTNWYTAK